MASQLPLHTLQRRGHREGLGTIVPTPAQFFHDIVVWLWVVVLMDDFLEVRSMEGGGGNVTSAGWQVILCDPIWHVSSRSGVVLVAQTAIRFLTLPCFAAFAGGPRICSYATALIS